MTQSKIRPLALFMLLSVLWNAPLFAMDEEDRENATKVRKGHDFSSLELNNSVNTLFCMRNDPSNGLEEFHKKCQRHLWPYQGLEYSSEDPNCGLEERVARFFFTACRRLINSKSEEEHLEVIRALASIKFSYLLKDKFLSACLCMTPQYTAKGNRYKIIKLIAESKSQDFKGLMQLYAGFGYYLDEDGDIVELIRILTSLPQEGGCFQQDKYGPLLRNSRVSSSKLFSFLREMSMTSEKDWPQLKKRAEEGEFSDLRDFVFIDKS